MKPNTSAMARVLSGKPGSDAGSPPTRISISPASNGYVIDTDRDTGPGGDYAPPQKSVYSDVAGVHDHIDKHLGKAKKVIDTGRKRTKRVRVVDTGRKAKKG